VGIAHPTSTANTEIFLKFNPDSYILLSA